jgi:DNA-directed RNA polymerase subunit RPC12/RpoP
VFTARYVLPTLYLCVLCGSENKQRLFHCTALTDWFLLPRRSVFTARYVLPTLYLCVLCGSENKQRLFYYTCFHNRDGVCYCAVRSAHTVYPSIRLSIPLYNKTEEKAICEKQIFIHVKNFLLESKLHLPAKKSARHYSCTLKPSPKCSLHSRFPDVIFCV